MPAPIDYNALPDDAFRQELREWIEANYPEDKRSPPRRLLYAEIEDWFQALSKKGWLAPNWPVEHGGMGLAPSKYVIYVEEMERHGCARLPDHAIQMVGPLLIKYGAERQKVHFLPRILAGEDIWCQGYSEPNAGSDLASIRTEAVKDGDDYIVNGQKIWTTLAHSANWIFMLVRTDKTASRPQKGISFLLASLETPGVTVRPITNLKGDQDFCEVFFDDVRVPMENLVGVENEGWTMAKALLGFERIFLGTPRLPGYSLNRLQLLCEKLGAFDDPSVLDQFTQHRLDVRDLTSAFEGYIDHIRKDGAVGPDVSFMKIWATEVNQQITETMIEESADALLAKHGGPGRVRSHRQQDPGFDRSIWREIAEAGWLGVLVPEAQGGIGLGCLELCVLAERLGAALAPEPYVSAAVLATSVVALADNDAMRDHLPPQMLAGDLIPALAWQSDPSNDVSLDQSKNSLNGQKTLVSPVGGADGFVVSANTPDGSALYWVPRDAEGLQIETDLLVDGSFSGRLTFAGTPAGDNLYSDGARANQALDRAVDRARLAASAELLGVMKQAFDITRGYLLDRVQFGKPIASVQTVQHRLADLFIQHRLACASVLEAIRAMDGDADDRTAAAAVSAAKARCGDAGLKIAREAVQLHGTIGYTDEYNIGLYLKRALVLSAWLGNSKYHRRRFTLLDPAT